MLDLFLLKYIHKIFYPRIFYLANCLIMERYAWYSISVFLCKSDLYFLFIFAMCKASLRLNVNNISYNKNKFFFQSLISNFSKILIF